jgi:hypothetical protein
MKKKLLLLLAVVLLIVGGAWWWIKKAPLRARMTLSALTVKTFPHEILGRVLERYVSNGLVDYAALANHRGDLDLYIAHIERFSPDKTPALFPSDEDKLAYYLNAYNALVLFNVLENPTLTSLADAKFDFFYRTTFVIGEETFNLYELENDIVRVRFPDPRIHFALNCASLGCPKLPGEPFVPGRLEEQLTRETTLFLSDPKNLRVEGDTLHLSQIFEFYPEDFTNAASAKGVTGTENELLIAYINQNRTEKLPLNTKISYIPYDWTINTSVVSSQ